MFFIAHLGFTAAPAAVAAGWWGKSRGFPDRAPDLRWMLAGAVLPDIVDKAVGDVILKSRFENGRIFLHTLAFALVMFVAGTYRWKRYGDNRVLLLACGVAGHLVLDRIWNEPATAYWPALGAFERYPRGETMLEQVLEYMREPGFWAAEVAGALALVASLRYLGIKNAAALRSFLVHGFSPSLAQFERRPSP